MPNASGEIEKITDNTSFLTGGTLTTELTYTYNDYGLPVKLTYTDVDGETRTVREETNLTYDGNGNILTEAVTEAYSGSATKTRTYQYDLGNRLISAAYDGTTTTYTYDAVGNRRLTRQEGTETAETYTYNYLNQLTRVQQGTAVTTYTYDARGNQTQQVQTGTGVTTTTNYGYDLANRLTSTNISNNAVIPLSTSATYAYNAQGQRVTRVEDEVITHFYYTGSALLFTTVNEYVLQTQNILDPVRRARERHEHRGRGRRGRQVLRLRRVRRDDQHGGLVLQRGDVHGERCGRLRPALHERAVLQPVHCPLPVAGHLYRFRLRPLDAAPLRLLQQ